MSIRWICRFAPALGLVIVATAPGIAGSSPIFLDGFESGDLCAWQGTCDAPADASGVWIGAVAFPGGVNRTLAVQIHQRVDGDLLGYLLGSNESWVVRSGAYSGGVLDLELALGSPAGDRVVALTGLVAGDRATLALTGDLAAQTVELFRRPEEVVERRFIFADLASGFFPAHFISLAVALDENGRLVAGSWSGSEQKPPWGRDGGVTSFSAAGGAATIGLDLDGGCSDGSLIEAAADPSIGFLTGTFNLIDCSGSQSGTLLGGVVDGTASSDVTEVLTALATVADQLEAGVSFASPHPAFTETYLHNGVDLAGLFADFAGEMAEWTDIDFEVLDISRISTRNETDEPPLLARTLGVDFRQIRSGVPPGGGLREDYIDTRGDVLALATHDQLGVVAEDAGVWKIDGDQQPAFDLPWNSAAIQPGDRRLEVATSGDPINAALGGFGGHFGPVSGHSFGDRKANFVGFLPADDGELDELIGDGIGDDDGVCSPAEFDAGGCAYWANLDGSLVRQRTPWYVAPHDGVITGMRLKSGNPPQGYFDGVPHWEVVLALDSGLKVELGHVGRIDDDVALAVLAETGCDPRSWDNCDEIGDESDLLQGASPIPVNAGDPVAQPQVLADEVPGFDGYRVGGGGFSEYPWAQMEFNVSVVVEGRLLKACVFGLLDSSRRDAYRTVMEADMADPASQRYRPRWNLPPWGWRAEAALCNTPTEGDTDYSQLYTNIGGWYERTDAGIVSDELFAFVPISTNTAIYDSASYEPGTDTLIIRQRAYYDSYMWEMPDASMLEVWEPAGEILQQTASSLLILWRDLGYTGGDVYQSAAYRLDENGLTIKWGLFAATSAAALAAAPTLGPAEPCDETTVICYNHKEQPGY